MKQKALDTLVRLSQRFGLTPLDRAGLLGRETPSTDPPLNPLEAELGRKT